MELINSLEKIGLTEKQAKVYLACLELGGARISDIAKKSKIKRTTCYHLIKELMEMGVVSLAKQKKAGFFLAEDPKILEQNFKLKLQTIQEILPQLDAVYNVLPQKPKVSFYEGVEGVKTIFEDTLKKTREGDTIYAYTGKKTFLHYMPKKWGQDFIKRRIDKKIRIKFIALSSEYAEILKEGAQQQLREYKIVPSQNRHFTADIQIYSNKVAIISPEENFMGILIESKEMAEMMKMAFELMWKGASQSNV
ncbi:MAG: helix-turn-helix domain-containing protein [Patescibacteria group bacterium]